MECSQAKSLPFFFGMIQWGPTTTLHYLKIPTASTSTCTQVPNYKGGPNSTGSLGVCVCVYAAMKKCVRVFVFLCSIVFAVEHSGLAVCLQLRESGRYNSVWETNSPLSFSLFKLWPSRYTDKLGLWTQGWARVLFTLLEKQQTARAISCERKIALSPTPSPYHRTFDKWSFIEQHDRLPF